MPADQRPNPDQLLAELQSGKEQSARGKLRIYFGASAGVGKTYAMLAAAKAARAAGIDAIIGLVETHGRAETAALVADLERLPTRQIEYKGRTLPEFDLDAALARKPALILVDELAHSNVAGSRHPKRWQDIEDLLAAGIDVWTTVNVQHLDSLNEAVGSITGIRVWETVPDAVFDAANEVILVDLPADELLRRLAEGKVYMPAEAGRALGNFFSRPNLTALRELALRTAASRVDAEMLALRRGTGQAASPGRRCSGRSTSWTARAAWTSPACPRSCCRGNATRSCPRPRARGWRRPCARPARRCNTS